ncbi:MAG: autoinducer binding domain-containing protein [Alphaproteobacteria bacterium]
MDIAKFITLSNEAQNIEQLYKLLEESLAALCGYDRVLFSLMSDHASLGLKAGHGIMRNYPDDWMRHYIEKGYEHLDPVPKFGFRHVGPFIWDGLPLVRDLSPQEDLCMNECREAGFYNGAAICLRGLTGESGGIGVASSSSKKPESEKEVKYKLSTLNVIAQQFYVIFCSLYEKKRTLGDHQVTLTSREVEIMRQMSLAKKDDAIAHDMNMTRHAVDFHVRNILVKFNAPNRMFAVMKAINGGFLTLDDAAFIRQSSRVGRSRLSV